MTQTWHGVKCSQLSALQLKIFSNPICHGPGEHLVGWRKTTNVPSHHVTLTSFIRWQGETKLLNSGYAFVLTHLLLSYVCVFLILSFNNKEKPSIHKCK
jgi:hypothetical protein